jgi:hypothetical protein
LPQIGFKIGEGDAIHQIVAQVAGIAFRVKTTWWNPAAKRLRQCRAAGVSDGVLAQEKSAPRQVPFNKKGRGGDPGLFLNFPSLNLAALMWRPDPLVGGIFIGCVDTGVEKPSHDIFGICAVQHTQFNYRLSFGAALLVVALVLAGKTAFSAGIADQGKPDPILGAPIDYGAAKGPCDPALDQADVTPGVDVDGRPVAQADLPTPPVHIDGQIAVPLKPAKGKGGNSAYVSVDGKKLDPLLNHQPACK